MSKRFEFVIIAVLLGGFGIQEFLLGNIGRGILGILFCWTGIPALVALIQIVMALVAKNDEEWLSEYPKCRL